MKKAITIKDIAEQLGLSRNTVAKALNGQYVPSKTREIVIHKAKELNYKSLNIEKMKLLRIKNIVYFLFQVSLLTIFIILYPLLRVLKTIVMITIMNYFSIFLIRI